MIKRLLQAIRRSPASYVFDLFTLLVELFFFDLLVDNWHPTGLQSYFAIYVLFCVGVYLKRWDPPYLHGLSRFRDRRGGWFMLLCWFLGLTIGLLAVASLMLLASLFFEEKAVVAVVVLPFALVFPFVYPVLLNKRSNMMGRSADKLSKAQKAKLRPLRLLSNFFIFLMCNHLLTFVYYNLEKIVQETEKITVGGGVAMVLLTFLILTMCYLPARIHTVWQSENDRMSYLSLLATCLAVAVFAVTGVHVPLL